MTAALQKRIADLTATLQRMEDALLVALPYVEDAIHSIDFKPGVARAHAAQVRRAITSAHSCARTGDHHDRSNEQPAQP